MYLLRHTLAHLRPLYFITKSGGCTFSKEFTLQFNVNEPVYMYLYIYIYFSNQSLGYFSDISQWKYPKCVVLNYGEFENTINIFTAPYKMRH